MGVCVSVCVCTVYTGIHTEKSETRVHTDTDKEKDTNVKRTKQQTNKQLEINKKNDDRTKY